MAKCKCCDGYGNHIMGNPYQWEGIKECSECNGTGKVKAQAIKPAP